MGEIIEHEGNAVIEKALPSNSGLVVGEELDAMMGNARLLLASGLLPKRFNNPESVVVAGIYGKGLGLDFMTSANEVYIVNGAPSCSSKIMLGVVRHREPQCQIKILEQTDQVCKISIQRKHDNDPQAFQYTIEEAAKANLMHKDNWKKHPVDMLTARCMTRAFRSTCMDLLGGFGYTPEELEEVKPSFDASKVKKRGIPKKVDADIVVIPEEAEAVSDGVKINQKALTGLVAEFKSTDQPGLVEMIHDDDTGRRQT